MRKLLIYSVFLILPCVCNQACADEKTVKQLEQEIYRLNQVIESLQIKLLNGKNVVQSEATPINLGRTSLAAVSASSVNGRRDPSDFYYGVPNAFDNGENWKDNINYSYWLASGGPSPWIEVEFDVPVAVTSIHVEGGPPFWTQLFLARGGEKDYGENRDQIILGEALHGISRVRLNFRGGGMTQVSEIRILGHVPPGTKYEVQKPRVKITRNNAADIADTAFQEWKTKLLDTTIPTVQEKPNEFIVTYTHHLYGYGIAQMTLNKKTGALSMKPLIKISPVE